MSNIRGERQKFAPIQDILNIAELPAVDCTGVQLELHNRRRTQSIVVGDAEKDTLAPILLAKVFDDDGGIDQDAGIFHVAPPVIDRWGPGGRVPLLVISPYARKGFVDSTFYDTTSLLKFIETRWNLEPLGDRDAAAADLTNLFDFGQEVGPVRAPAPVVGQDVRAPAPATPTTSPSPTTFFTSPLGIGLLIMALAALAGIVLLALRRRRHA